MNDELKRRSVRLKRFDYSTPGAYFVTICVKDHKCLFGRIIMGKMELNAYGIIAWNEWEKTGELRRVVKIDSFVIMPNHLHGILTITGRGTLPRAQNHDEINAGTLQRAPTTVETFGMPRSGSLSTIVRLFKATSTKQINILRGTPGAEFWQRNYYEHIVRNEAELNKTRRYIELNPAQWQFDRENEQRIENDEYENTWMDILPCRARPS
ncbi:MAG TPA: transposase [Acidobacteriota bacterium]|nr:transposase [Acidobacteriota bacterium]